METKPEVMILEMLLLSKYLISIANQFVEIWLISLQVQNRKG